MKEILKGIILLTFVLSGCAQKQQIKSQQERFATLRVMRVQQDTCTKDVTKSVDILNCPITPAMYSDTKVPQIYKTNDLRRRSGYATTAKGFFIKITGAVVDRNCVPVCNATVQIWHPDSQGMNKNPAVKGYLNDSMMYSKQDSRFEKIYHTSSSDENFTGSGSTVTDNLGRFTFFSVMPGSTDGKKPSVMFRVLHHDFNELTTVMYFPDNQGVSSVLRAEKVQSSSEEVTFFYKITLDGENKFLKY